MYLCSTGHEELSMYLCGTGQEELCTCVVQDMKSYVPVWYRTRRVMYLCGTGHEDLCGTGHEES